MTWARASGPGAAAPLPSANLEQRRHQIYLVLCEEELRHVRQFGAPRHYADGEIVFEAGQRPSLANLKRLEGRGVYYWASSLETRLCKGHEVILVGGGNSAGQAAVFLAGHAARVRMLVRREGLAATMSEYRLVARQRRGARPQWLHLQ